MISGSWMNAQKSQSPQTHGMRLAHSEATSVSAMQALTPASTTGDKSQSNEVCALVKDPEVSNKTWTLAIEKHATIAEVIYSFLIRRNRDLNQACQLRLLLGGHVLSDVLDRTIEDSGMTNRCLLHSMWKPSAGGCSNAATCERCQKIAAAGLLTNSRKMNQLKAGMRVGNTGSNEEEGSSPLPSANRPDCYKSDASKGRPSSIKDSRKPYKEGGPKSMTERGFNDKGSVNDKHIKGLNLFSGGQHTPTVELVAQLERLVIACGHAADLVGPLERLAKLYKHGALTEAEFSRGKTLILFQSKDNRNTNLN